MILFVIDCSLHQFAFHVSSLTSGKHSFLFQLNRSVEFACLHGSQRIQGHLIVRHSFSVKTSLSEFSKLVLRNQVMTSECSHQDAHTPVVLFCCVCVFFFV